MTLIVDSPSSALQRWFPGIVAGLTVFVVAVLRQPVLSPPLASVLLVALSTLLAILLGVRSLRRRPVASVWVGPVLAALVYVYLWVFAAPHGFPSENFGSPAAPITAVYGKPASVRLEVGVGTCNQDPHVSAMETEDHVRLRSNEKLPRGASNDCADADIVILDRPLGDRAVIDDATGKTVEVLPGESCEEDSQQADC